VFFIKLPIAKLMHDIVYLAKTYLKKFLNYLGTSEGSILNFYWSDGSVPWYNNLFLGEGVFEEVGWSKNFCPTKS